MLVVGGVPRARPGGLHQAWPGSSSSGPAPLRLVSITKCLPPSPCETLVPYARTASSVWKLETFSANPSARATPARVSGSTSLTGSGIHAGLPASRYTLVFGSFLKWSIASLSSW